MFVKRLNRDPPSVREIIKDEVRKTIPIVAGMAVDEGKNKIIIINEKIREGEILPQYFFNKFP